MANLYESDSFNIVSVYQKDLVENYDDGESDLNPCLVLKIQRLPLDQFPQLTDVYTTPDEIPLNTTKSEFLNIAPPIVIQKLQDFDSTFSGSEVELTIIDSLTQKFID
jgi:hypothetical protein